eukprot:c13361_g1_i1 orf=63-287(-)
MVLFIAPNNYSPLPNLRIHCCFAGRMLAALEQKKVKKEKKILILMLVLSPDLAAGKNQLGKSALAFALIVEYTP